MEAKIRGLLAGILLLGASAANAQAHTISYGWVPGSNAGEVDFWFGTYHVGAPNEGSLQVVDADATVYGPESFDKLAYDLPSGLTLNDNYFYADGWSGYTIATWQGVTIAGLSPGDYQYSFIGISSAYWSPANNSIFDAFTLGAEDIGSGVSPVPLPPAVLLFLSGLGLMGFFGWRKKQVQAAV